MRFFQVCNIMGNQSKVRRVYSKSFSDVSDSKSWTALWNWNVKMSLVIDIHHSKMLFEEKITSFSLRLSRLVISKDVMKWVTWIICLHSNQVKNLKITWKSAVVFFPKNGNHYPSLSFRILSLNSHGQF